MSEDYEDDDLDYDGWCVDCDDDHGVIQDDEDWLCTECLLVRYHKLAEENQRLAAEVERLRQRDPTLKDAVELLNKHKHHGFEWTASDDGHSVSGTGRNNYGNPEWATWSAKEAIRAAKMIEAVAENLLREKEAARG